MKKTIFGLLLILGVAANAQFSKASLTASGLTCSMCSKAVKNALEKVPFVSKVDVDIANQQYNFSFKQGANVDFDALEKAVDDAGFSVASLNVTASINNLHLAKDEHLEIGGQHFHFLNGDGRQLQGDVSFSVVDKGFVPQKQAKKFAAMSKMACVQTGRMAACCAKEDAAKSTRIYHVVI